MRYIPSEKYDRLPCSYVGTGCAYEDITGKAFNEPLPEELKANGYLSLDGENKFLRSVLPVKKKVYYRRGERISLAEFLATNTERCCVCVYGHFVYVSAHDYWSFFDNDNDDVVCVWYLK